MPRGKILSAIDQFWFEGIFPWIERKDGIEKQEKKGKETEEPNYNEWDEAVDNAMKDAGGVPRQ